MKDIQPRKIDAICRKWNLMSRILTWIGSPRNQMPYSSMKQKTATDSTASGYKIHRYFAKYVPTYAAELYNDALTWAMVKRSVLVNFAFLVVVWIAYAIGLHRRLHNA